MGARTQVLVERVRAEEAQAGTVGSNITSPDDSRAQASDVAAAWLVLRPLVASGGIIALSLLLTAAVVRARNLVGRTGTGGTDDLSRCRRWLSIMRRPSPALSTLLAVVTLFSWAAGLVYSSPFLGAFAAGMIFCSLQTLREAWDAVTPIQSWLSRFFFGATIAFTIPIDGLFERTAFVQGVVVTFAALLGKFVSGAWAAPCSCRADFWRAWTQVGCAMIGRGELGFLLAKEAVATGILPQGAYCATVWALLLATLLGPIFFRLSMRWEPSPSSFRELEEDVHGVGDGL